MLETIFGALNDALVSLAGLFLKWTNNVLELDVRTFVQHFPILASGYKLFQTLAVGLTIIIAIYSIWKFFLGPSNALKEPPTRIIMRLMASIAMIFMGGHLFEYAVTLANIPYQAFLQLGDGGVRTADEIFGTSLGIATSALVGSLTGGVTSLVEIILSLILLVAIFKSLFRLIMEILERYILVGVLTFASPLASSTITSTSASTIFARFLNMYFGQLLLMALSVWSYNLALSALGSIEAGNTVYIIFQILIVMAACKIGTRMDTFLQQLGVGVGVTGGGLADEVMGMAMAGASMFRKAWGGLNGGGEDGTGHRSDAVLGGVRGSDGVRPETVGAGVPGMVRSAWNRGMNAYEQGASGKDVAKAAASGMKEGYGNPVGAIFGRGLQDKAKNVQDARNQAIKRPPVTTATTGSVVKSADGSTAHLTKQAAENNLRINGKTGAVSGDVPAVGNFMAANMGKKDAFDSVRATAKGGDPMASEHALFGTSNALGYDPENSEISQEEYDQEMSGATFAAFAGGFNDLEEKAKEEGDDLSTEEKNLNAVGQAMKGTLEQDDSHGRIENLQAKDMEGVKGGRVVTGDVKNAQGQTAGTFTALNAKGYESLSDDQKKGYIPVSSASGGVYYMRASGATVDDHGVPSMSRTGAVTPLDMTGTAAPQGQVATATVGAASVGSVAATQGGAKVNPPAGAGHPSYFTHNLGEDVVASEYAKERGVDVSNGVIKPSETAGADFEGAGDSCEAATALNQAIAYSEQDPYYRDLVDSTVSDPECNRPMAYDALFSRETGDIGQGHDPAVSRIVDVAVGSDNVAQIIGAVQADDAPVIPEESAAHMGDALRAVADGSATPDDNYRCENFSAVGGVVEFDYATPEGGYHIQMAEGGSAVFEGVPSGTGEVGGLRYDVSVAPNYVVAAPAETIIPPVEHHVETRVEAPVESAPLQSEPHVDHVDDDLRSILGDDYDGDDGRPKSKRSGGSKRHRRNK